MPRGAVVSHVPWVMGRREDIWGPTARAFDAERFLREPRRALDPYTFAAFLGGPRACLGQRMALEEAALVLAVVFGDFELTLDPPEQAADGGIAAMDSLTLPQRRGVTVRVTRRAPPPVGMN